MALFAKISRLLLAVSVSVWMAGGCLFGCSNTNVMAAERTQSSAGAASDEDCRAVSQAHSCCTRPVAQKQKPNVKKSLRFSKDVVATHSSGTLTAPAHGMKDCPLLANNTAATSKNSGGQLDPGRTPVAVLPSVENLRRQSPVTIVASHVPNRGPTHLHCCVFLI